MLVKRGSVLIELLIVIVILGVLAAAIIPNLSKFVGSGKVGAANAELATVKTTVAAYQSEHNGNFPCTTQPAGTTTQLILKDATGILPYISSAAVVGVYNVDVNGIVTGVTYTGLTWDTRALAERSYSLIHYNKSCAI